MRFNYAIFFLLYFYLARSPIASASDLNCLQLLERTLNTDFSLFHKFNLPASSLLLLHHQWKQLTVADRNTIAPILHDLPALSRFRIHKQQIVLVLGLLLQHRGKLDDLLLKGLLAPQSLVRSEAQLIYLLLCKKWWFSQIPGGGVRSLDPLRYNKLQALNLISSKIRMMLGKPARPQLPSYLLTLLGKNSPLRELVNPSFYLIQYLNLLEKSPFDLQKIAAQLTEELSQMEDHFSPRFQELSNLQWLLTRSSENFTLEDLKAVAAELPAQVTRFQHLHFWQQKYTVPLVISLGELYLLALILEKVVITFLEQQEHAEDDPSYSPQLRPLPPIPTQHQRSSSHLTPLEELMRQFNQGEISREVFLRQAEQNNLLKDNTPPQHSGQ